MREGRGPNPVLYFVLFLPFGATSGFVSIALGYVGTKHGLKVTEVGSLVALSLAPQTVKFLWAPVSDAVWTRKNWYTSANLICAATIAAMGLIPLTHANLGVFEVMVVANSVASTLVAMSVEAMMAHGAPPAERGRAAGWSQAGNLGGQGVGGGLGLVLLENLEYPWMATSILGGALVLCNLALRGLHEPDKGEGHLLARVKDVGLDLWGVIKSRNGVLALALCFLPMGAGAAAGLFSAIAKDWHASAGQVELMNGWLSGIVAAFGCLVGGRISDAMSRKLAYALCGGILALVALGMALTPPAPWSYATFALAYAFASGLCYGTFTGFVLEVIGGGAAATKYNTFASLSNIPITYMTTVDGWAASKYGARHMLAVDAASGAIGLVLLLSVVGLMRLIYGKTKPAAVDAPALPLPR